MTSDPSISDDAPADPPPKLFTQDEFERKLGERVARERQARQSEVEALKGKAEQYDALAAASRTDQERAVAEARAAERQDAAKTWGGRLVEAELRGRLAGRLDDPERVQALVEGANHGRYLTDKGDVDTDALQKWVDTVAGPAKAAGEPAKPAGPPSHGSGDRGAAPGKADPWQLGVDQAAKRFGNPTKV